MNTNDIDFLISALRAETEKNSISPERVGYILRLAIDQLSQHGNDQLLHIPADRNLSLNSVIADREDDGVVLSSKEFDDSSMLDGRGYGLRKIGNDYHFIVDYLSARKGGTFTKLVMHEAQSIGAVLVASACDGEVNYVNWDSESEAGNPIYIVTIKDWDNRPQFVSGDIVRCSRWDSLTQQYIFYCGVVWMVTQDIVYLEIVDGDAAPLVGDRLVHFGNTDSVNHADRQGVAVISVESGKPNISLYGDMDSVDFIPEDKIRLRLGSLDELVLDGKALSGYGLWTSNLFLGSRAEASLKAIVDTSINELATAVTELSHAFEVSNQGLLSAQKAVTSLQTGGGRNLLLKTNQGGTGWSCITDSPTTPIIVDAEGGAVAFDYVNGNTSSKWEIYTFDLRPELIVQGRIYTLTVEVKGVNMVSNMVLQGQIANADANGVLLPATLADNPISSIEEWTKLTFTFTATASGNKNGEQRVRLIVPQDKIGNFNYIEFRNLKLEEGGVATAYTAAPEDYVDGEITAVREETVSAIEQTANEIRTSVEEVNTTLDGRIDTNTTLINQTANSISQSVSELQTNVDGRISGLQSEIQQTADEISLKVKEVVGVNSLNRAYGTQEPKTITSFSNIVNQTVKLYDVSGLTGGENFSASFIIRVRDIAFDTHDDTVTSKINLQLDTVFGFRGFGVNITEDTFKDIAPDENGYRNARLFAEGLTLPMYSYGTDTQITPDMVGAVYLRLDYITATSENASVEIKELKIELGDKCTEWTSRTQDTESALLSTGVDIENKKITVTANQFEIKNNEGDVTANVDDEGNLATTTVLCWNKDSDTKLATPYLTTLNRGGNSYLEFFYPLSEDNGNDNIAFQIGWNEDSKSVFRFYNKDGSLAWLAGDFTEFLKNMQTETTTTITEAKFHYIGDVDVETACARVQNTLSLSANATLYRVVKQENGAVTESYYTTDKAGINRVDGGAYTLPGTPMIGLKTDGEIEGNYYSRTLYFPDNGKLMGVQHLWVQQSGASDIIIDSPALPNQ